MLQITTKEVIIKPINSTYCDVKIPLHQILLSKEDLDHILDVLNELYGEELLNTLCKRFDLVTEEIYNRDRRYEPDDHINFDE